MLPSAESIQIILPIISIVFLAMGFYRNVYGVIAYFVILNGKLGDMYPSLGAIRFELVAAVIVLISILLSGKGLYNAFPRTSQLNKPFWAFIIVGFLSMAQAVDYSTSWQNGGYPLFKLCLFYIMVVASIHDRRDLNMLIWAFVLVTVWIGYEPVSNYIRGIAPQYGYGDVAHGRFGAASGHVALANTMNQAVPITGLLALCIRTRWKKLLLIGIAVFLVFGVIATKSRGGFIGLAAIGAGFAYLNRTKTKNMLVIAILAFALLIFSGASYWSHMSTITHGVHGSRSANDRYIGLLNGISMLMKRPLLGVGIGCYAEARRQYFSYYFWSHNLYGELLGELGLASVFWFYWMYSVWRGCKYLKINLNPHDEKLNFYHNMLTGIQFSIILRLIMGNFTHGWYIWFWFLMAALCVSIENIISKESFSESAAPVASNTLMAANVQSSKLKER
jgi:hypothetical protein